MRLFQLRCYAHRAASLAGEVFNFVGSITNQYRVVTEQGEEFALAGYYAIVPRDGKDYFELFITGQPNDPAFRGMLDFKSIKNAELRDPQAVIGLLFYVSPTQTIVRVQNQTGNGITFAEPGYKMGGG
jgi:hypothetical protein